MDISLTHEQAMCKKCFEKVARYYKRYIKGGK